MDWFQGSVSEAIGIAKQCGGLIAFQVVDGGELSSATTAAWAAPSVRSCFTNSTFGMFLTLIRVATYSLWSPSFTQSTEHAAFPVPLRWYSIFVHLQITCQYVYTFFLTYSIFYINILLLLCSLLFPRHQGLFCGSVYGRLCTNAASERLKRFHRLFSFP